MYVFFKKNALWGISFISFLVFFSFYEWRFNTINNRIDELQSQIFINSDNQQLSSEDPPEISKNNYYTTSYAPSNSGADKNTMQDLFDSPKNPNVKENTIDKIKTRYEGILVNYLLLKKCGKTGTSDYQLITSAMQKELLSQSTPTRLKYDILTAAKGSYDEIYARSNCNDEEIMPTLQKYLAYIKSL